MATQPVVDATKMRSAAPGTINPADGTTLDPVETSGQSQVDEAVAAARGAQVDWAARSLSDRIALIQKLGLVMTERIDEIVAILQAETGRSRTECIINEAGNIVGYVKTACKVAKGALAPEKVAISGLDYPGKKARTELVPRGVVGVIAPWNYPLANFYKPLFPALLAGNGVVLKPSEHTPRSGQWVADVCDEVLPKGLVSAVQGRGEVGAWLLESGIDAVTFTGSVATGKKVAARAGELLIPCSVELGGKDAAIVLADCDLDRTALGIAQWAMHNCGQNCAAIERVYVEEKIADAFVEKLGKIASGLKVAPDGAISDLGPLQNPQQLSIVEDHVQDAVSKGATVVAGGHATGRGLGFEPTVLDACTDAMKVVAEETFGPVVAVICVNDAEEAIRRANAAPYGLNGSVWTRNLARGESIARRLEVGVALVNNHAIPGAMANIPWTGVKDTGPGVAASKHSYHVFARPMTIFIDSGSKPDPWWMPYDSDAQAFAEALVERGKGSLGAMLKLGGLVGKRVKTLKKFASTYERSGE